VAWPWVASVLRPILLHANGGPIGSLCYRFLRSHFVSALDRSGASVKAFQTLARHAKAETILKHYAKASQHDLRGVVEAFPQPKDISNQVPHYSPTSGDGMVGDLTETGGSTFLPGSADVSCREGATR